MLTNLREQWFSNVRADILSGLVVGLALIPEAIAFSIIAGVDPQIGLYASFCIAVIISFCRWSFCHDFGSNRCYGLSHDDPSERTWSSVFIRSYYFDGCHTNRSGIS
ncbi:SulP family inorganic anion transporter [Acinetobacter nosocomialis]|nr:SulP family inorganic anion transporter [Acinetobacter nosocomialis]